VRSIFVAAVAPVILTRTHPDAICVVKIKTIFDRKEGTL
jgi:hypothetical protein